MQTFQWSIAAGTAIFVALVAFFQWRTAQQAAVLNLFERRLAIYNSIRNVVRAMQTNASLFDQKMEIEFLEAQERATFFFDDDVGAYLNQMWTDIVEVKSADSELTNLNDSAERIAVVAKRRVALNRITAFHSTGQLLFARYMRFSQTVPFSVRRLVHSTARRIRHD
jgi:hypothetical protein